MQPIYSLIDYSTVIGSNEANDSSSTSINSCKQITMDNVVTEDKLKVAQEKTLDTLKKYLSKTYGPMGSYTAIISGNNAETIKTEYSKDGLKVLKNILFDTPIELSLQSEMREICSYVERKVGDGTTSAVILSSLIYSELLKIMKKSNVPPRKINKEFTDIVSICKQLIMSKKKDITLNDVYDICMISTNGNEEVSKQIMDIYKEYGLDVNIDVSISNDQYTKIKCYDGLTINEGYSDSAYINNLEKATANIHNANVYAFQDPIDTPEMTNFLAKIIVDNITNPGAMGEDYIPTVIVAPIIGKDASSELAQLVDTLYLYNKSNNITQKPPILIITNLSGVDEDIALDITRLCNCRYIKKYINPDIQKSDQEKGLAPTMDTIHNFAGHCELVSADREKTKFINPEGMVGDTGAYDSLVAFLEAEIKNSEEQNDDKMTISRLKKRLRALKANLVEFLVGGISISDRDALRDLVEDATKNCASASANGVGRAANFEALEAIYKLAIEVKDETSLKKDIINAILKAYVEAAKTLYSTVIADDDIVYDVIEKSIENECPFNVIDLFEVSDDRYVDAKPGKNVLCSIRTDVEILDAISKIVTIMVTSNQCLLQATNINRY